MSTCQNCGIEAPTKHVVFFQNIGALVVRFHRKIDAELCKPCINKYFLSYTGITAVLGWWGVISFFATIIFLINNIARYLGTLSLPKPAAGAGRPVLTEAAAAKIRPFVNEIVHRTNNSEPVAQVARDVAARAGVTPAQVVLYLSALARMQSEAQRRKVPNAA
ncbi:MAG TPA: hypothetical protein VEF07_05460 [Candidatus Binataceae bacterium]|nr:hypothetical protein [Candidatus Binataceae bacterium]